MISFLQQLYLPREKSTPLLFLQGILSNEKRHLRKGQVRLLKIPLWTELSVARIWPQATELPDFLLHMPDEWQQDLKKVERSFFWAVLTTLAPEFVEELVLDVRRQRLGAAQERLLQPRQINVAPEWVQPLLSQPFFPSKCPIISLSNLSSLQ